MTLWWLGDQTRPDPTRGRGGRSSVDRGVARVTSRRPRDATARRPHRPGPAFPCLLPAALGQRSVHAVALKVKGVVAQPNQQCSYGAGVAWGGVLVLRVDHAQVPWPWLPLARGPARDDTQLPVKENFFL